MIFNEFVHKLRKVGNSVVVTVPKQVLEKYGLEEGQFVQCIICEAGDEPLSCRLIKEGSSNE